MYAIKVLKYPTRNDWGQAVIEDLKDVKLDMSAVKHMSKKQVKAHIKRNIENLAFEYLTRKK